VVHVWTDITSTTLVAAIEWYTRDKRRRTKQVRTKISPVGKQVSSL
jgi:hypothetical protein